MEAHLEVPQGRARRRTFLLSLWGKPQKPWQVLDRRIDFKPRKESVSNENGPEKWECVSAAKTSRLSHRGSRHRRMRKSKSSSLDFIDSMHDFVHLKSTYVLNFLQRANERLPASET
jgi:hypothetical protein